MSFNNFPPGGAGCLSVDPGPEAGLRVVSARVYRKGQNGAIEKYRGSDFVDGGGEVEISFPVAGTTYEVRVRVRSLRDAFETVEVSLQGSAPDGQWLKAETHPVELDHKDDSEEVRFWVYTKSAAQ